MRTTTEIEFFYAAGSKAGALIRRRSEDFLQTTLVFKVKGGLRIHLSQK